MRPGCPAGLSNHAHRVTLRHARSLGDAVAKPAQVTIESRILPLVAHDHDVSIAALLAGKLDIEARRIEKKCPRCTEQNGGTPVYHWFDVETGELVETNQLHENHLAEASIHKLLG